MSMYQDGTPEEILATGLRGATQELVLKGGTYRIAVATTTGADDIVVKSSPLRFLGDEGARSFSLSEQIDGLDTGTSRSSNFGQVYYPITLFPDPFVDDPSDGTLTNSSEIQYVIKRDSRKDDRDEPTLNDRLATDELVVREVASQAGGTAIERVDEHIRQNERVRGGTVVHSKLPGVRDFTELLSDALSDAPGIPSEFVDGLDFFLGAAGPGDAANYMGFINGPARLTAGNEGVVPVSLALYVNTFDLNEVPWTEQKQVYVSPSVEIPVSRSQEFPPEWNVLVEDLKTELRQRLADVL